jgi:hypothetical protein
MLFEDIYYPTAFRDLQFIGASSAYTTQVRVPCHASYDTKLITVFKKSASSFKSWNCGLHTDTQTQHGNFWIQNRVSVFFLLSLRLTGIRQAFLCVEHSYSQVSRCVSLSYVKWTIDTFCYSVDGCSLLLLNVGSTYENTRHCTPQDNNSKTKWIVAEGWELVPCYCSVLWVYYISLWW